MADRGLDLIYYVGEINRKGYEQLCEILASARGNSAALILRTLGGDADAGFRIARALQHRYGGFEVWIPSFCKSAGTLICLGAQRLVMADRGELGPLDVQIRKQDELFDYGSGLDVIQSLGHMQTQAMNAFRTYVMELQSGAGLSTRTAAEIATKLATGLFSPIYGQIDPVRLGELQRSTNIASAYGEILAEKSKNLATGAVQQLVADYPSHGFVIDRALARKHFIRVDGPSTEEALLLDWIYAMGHSAGGVASVFNLSTLIEPEDTHNATASVPAGDPGEPGYSERAEAPSDGDSSGEEQPGSRSVCSDPHSRAGAEQAVDA